MIAIERIWAELDIRSVLPTIQAPTLVLHRTGDQVEDVEAGRDFARRIPGAQFVELAGADWPVWAGDQRALFSVIDSFLSGIREEEFGDTEADLPGHLLIERVRVGAADVVRLEDLAEHEGPSDRRKTERSVGNAAIPFFFVLCLYGFRDHAS